MPESDRVRSMFARIAGRYDLLNRLLSAGVDRSWRRRAVALAGELEGRTVVDLCCGTGDLALAFARAGARVIGVDFTLEMLAAGRAKVRRRGAGRLQLALGDALVLPVPDDAADVACVAFGLRNLADRRAGLSEMARVVRPGGQVQVLEFANPPGRLSGAAYRFYFTRVLPRVGGLISGQPAAYRYLPDTVLAWPEPPALQEELEACGLVDCGHRLLTGGIACLHWGRVREA